MTHVIRYLIFAPMNEHTIIDIIAYSNNMTNSRSNDLKF